MILRTKSISKKWREKSKCLLNICYTNVFVCAFITLTCKRILNAFQNIYKCHCEVRRLERDANADVCLSFVWIQKYCGKHLLQIHCASKVTKTINKFSIKHFKLNFVWPETKMTGRRNTKVENKSNQIDINKLCRLCLSKLQEKSVNILDSSIEDPLLIKILDCTGVVVSNFPYLRSKRTKFIRKWQ